MKAVRIDQWGISHVGVSDEVEKPQPGQGEVLVKVRASSVNPLDWKICEGYLQEFLTLPLMLGSDVAGDIESVGEGVEGLEPGMAIYGMQGMRGGAFAEYAVMPVTDIGKKPTTLSYSEAAVIPHAAVTAWQALLEAGQLQPGQRVLIHAAAGGVGHFAVQFAKMKGAYVVGTASARNETFLRELGVDEFVNYQAAPFETVVKDLDLVLDTLGFDVSARSLEVIKPGGKMICLVTPPPMDVAAAHQVEAQYFGAHPSPELLNEIAGLIDSGKIKVHIDQVFKLDQIREAFQTSAQQHVRGKLAVEIEA